MPGSALERLDGDALVGVALAKRNIRLLVLEGQEGVVRVASRLGRAELKRRATCGGSFSVDQVAEPLQIFKEAIHAVVELPRVDRLDESWKRGCGRSKRSETLRLRGKRARAGRGVCGGCRRLERVNQAEWEAAVLQLASRLLYSAPLTAPHSLGWPLLAA